MPKRIQRDWGEFRDVVSGRVREAIKHRIKTGQIFKNRGTKKQVGITIPRLDLPQFQYGKAKKGVGRGPGKIGDVVGKDPQKGKGGPKAGEGHSEGVDVTVDMEEILKFLKDELGLPNLKPKPSETFEEVKKRYNSLAKTGPDSLIHFRRTMRNAIKRSMAMGKMDQMIVRPGFLEAMPMLQIINDDIRYRQYTERRIPISNAIIFFARDGSGSMDSYKCEIVSDMAWWIDMWIRSFYKRTERVYIWHDTEAQEVGEDKFYRHRYGGGTLCSSATKLIGKLLEHRYPPEKYNVYVFYFSDGENMSYDNDVFVKTLQEDIGPDKVNFIGCTQILAYGWQDTLNGHVQKAIEGGKLDPDFVRLAQIGQPKGQESNFFYGREPLTDEERSEQIKKAIKDLLGTGAKAKDVPVIGG